MSVPRPVVRPRAPAPAPRSSSAPPRTQLPPAEAAPEANAQVVYSPTAVATPARDIASSVTVITAADIEREQRRTVPDALANVPGLNIVQTGGPGGQTSVFMRGTNSNQVKPRLTRPVSCSPALLSLPLSTSFALQTHVRPLG